MTAKWLLVARPRPQKTQENAENQAKYIWEEAERLLEDDKNPRKINTIICWFFVPNDEEAFNSKLHTDVHPIPAKDRVKRYTEIFEKDAKKIGRLHNLFFQDEYYDLGYGLGPEDQTINRRSQIVIHDHSTFLGIWDYWALKNTMDYDSYMKSKYKKLLFPSISLMAQDSHRNLDNHEVVKTNTTNSSVVWYG